MPDIVFSEALKTFNRSKKIRPFSQERRERMYEMTDVKAQPKIKRQFQSFNTTPRKTRNSFLLRVTCEPNTKTNYDPNFSSTSSLHRRATIDKATFKRKIGPVNQNQYQKQLNPQADKRCIKAQKSLLKHRPLTVRETHKWRKTQEHLDFKKQSSTKRTTMGTFSRTRANSACMKTLQETTQSNFNNYKRFSMRAHKKKCHNFKSDFPHQYLRSIENREIEPEYDVRVCKQFLTRQSMREPKGQVRFNLNKQKIKTRFDRSDPDWLQTLDYQPENLSTLRDHNTLDFDLLTSRKPNEVFSEYAFRQSIQPLPPKNK